jgi:hypothetical protein
VRLRGVGATDLADLVAMRESMFVVQVRQGSTAGKSATVQQHLGWDVLPRSLSSSPAHSAHQRAVLRCPAHLLCEPAVIAHYAAPPHIRYALPTTPCCMLVGCDLVAPVATCGPCRSSWLVVT